jgi:peptidyl-dipeptidase A
VPPVLREGANRGFHEGIGELISLAAAQVPYLQQVGILDPKKKVDPAEALLVDALERTVVFIPWSAGVMTRFEYELYEQSLPPERWQSRWWELVEQHQGIAAPPGRAEDPTACDACTKTHIIDDPAGYYDYAVATVVKHQLHDHICRRIVGADPHACNYYGNKAVGDFLKGILRKGATEDWRKVIEEATGEPLSTRAMVEYYAPFQRWLNKEERRRR